MARPEHPYSSPIVTASLTAGPPVVRNRRAALPPGCQRGARRAARDARPGPLMTSPETDQSPFVISPESPNGDSRQLSAGTGDSQRSSKRMFELGRLSSPGKVRCCAAGAPTSDTGQLADLNYLRAYALRRVIIWLRDKLSEVAPRVCELLEHVRDRLFGLLVALGVEDLAQGGGDVPARAPDQAAVHKSARAGQQLYARAAGSTVLSVGAGPARRR